MGNSHERKLIPTNFTYITLEAIQRSKYTASNASICYGTPVMLCVTVTNDKRKDSQMAL